MEKSVELPDYVQKEVELMVRDPRERIIMFSKSTNTLVAERDFCIRKSVGVEDDMS
jgi:hypothetical protein